MEALEKKLKELGIKPSTLSLYESAFTHASYTNEHPECQSYDRLEFLGDSLLDMIIADFLFHAYPKADSGLLSKMRSRLVEGTTLTELTEKTFRFAPLIRYSVGEAPNERNHHKIHEDVFESFIAAVYLDQGYVFVRSLLQKVFQPLIEQVPELIQQNDMDPKTQLQALLSGASPVYVIVDRKNLNTEDVEFTVEARLGNTVLGIGRGHNHNKAERAAAFDALSKKVGEDHGSN